MARGDGESSLTVKATLALRELLLRGELEPGERVAELALTDRLGVSRTPLRAALLHLEHEGLLEALSGGGFRVRAVTLDDVADAIELRGVLEGAAARFAAERLEDDGELAELRACDAELADVVRERSEAAFLRYLELNDRFHAELHRLAKSASLHRALGNVLALPFGAPNALLPSDAEVEKSWEIFAVAHYQHGALIDAIAARAGGRAEEVAREHARIAFANLALVLENRELLARLPGAQLLSKAL